MLSLVLNPMMPPPLAKATEPGAPTPPIDIR